MFPFYDSYIERFSAAKELERMDQMNDNDNDDTEESPFSLEYDTVPRSNPMMSSKPIRIVEIAEPARPIDKISTPIALNEHKYTKRNNFYCKQTPRSPTKVSFRKDVPSFQSSQKTQAWPLSTQHFHKYWEEKPMASNNTADSLINRNNRNTPNEWFESSGRLAETGLSQLSHSGNRDRRFTGLSWSSQYHSDRTPDYGTSSCVDEFFPSQSKFNW